MNRNVAGQAQISGGAANLGVDPLTDQNDRLLLWQVLLEEYESLRKPPSDKSNRDEVELYESEEIKDEVEGYLKDAKSKGGGEEQLNADMSGYFYRSMAAAQRRKARAIVNKNADAYEKQYASPGLEDDELRRIVDRAVVAKTYGHIQDLRWKYQQEFSEVPNEEERRRKVDEAVLKAIRREALGKEDEPEGNLKGTGSGKTKRRDGMTREGAVKVTAQSLRSALCLSGGGIRSATFNLGILQGLARHGLLERFDYLSTVSGGGFIGGWLSAWICRQGIDKVMNELGKQHQRPDPEHAAETLEESPRSPFKPDPKPVEHLRIYSNYLSPQPGLLSADTWTLIATFVRNLTLNWLVFVPVLALLLMLPRIWTALLLRSVEYEKYAWPSYLVVGLAAGIWSFSYIGTHLPSSNSYSSNPCGEKYKGSEGRFIVLCLIWMTVSAASFAIYFWVSPHQGLVERYQYVGLAELIVLVPWVICAIRIRKTRKERPRNFYLILGLVTLLIIIAQFIAGQLLRSAMTALLSGRNELIYATFAVPVILILMSVGATLIAGFTSHFSSDDDQEWWARTGAWMAIVIVAWCILNVLVLYGPLLILTLGATFNRFRQIGFFKLPWADWGKLLGTAVGVVSGIITLVGGFSAKTPANSKEAQKAGMGGLLLSVATILVAPIFLAFVFILIALGTNWLLTSEAGQSLSFLIDRGSNSILGFVGGLLGYTFQFGFASGKLPSPFAHHALLSATSFRYLVVGFVLLAGLAFVMGRLISTNVFSLQYMWRNRIIRAYLGASRKVRCPEPFTGFDDYDNLYMSELRRQPAGVVDPGPRKGRPADDLPYEPRAHKLLHVLNVALNLAGGEKLQWQDRRAESFTVSPLHAGSYWLGYRRSFRYGGEEGISLGAAIAISGAFVSPNMGYMMTSPVVRFLMTLFNIRFGWWLGNPGPHGEKASTIERLVSFPLKIFGFVQNVPFRQRSPVLSVIPIVSEAFGSTDQNSSYVYLSDGGHFENLGLYEMVLRRCRFIVVSDASTDPDYSFQSLAMSVRQIRVDLGVPIDMPDLSVDRPSQAMKSKYCAIGTIRYSCVDRDAGDATTKDEDFDGVLIYIKPSLIGEEPRDVINYWQGSNGFPQEIIVDQWFSEAQFESYRALGSHIIDAICGGDRNEVNFPAFARKVREHNQLDFRAFRTEISYAALEQQFKEIMQQIEIPSYKRKVQKFLDKLLR